MDGLFARWRREIETELEAAQLARNAALLEQDEAERAEAMVRADLAAAEAAFDTRLSGRSRNGARSYCAPRARRLPSSCGIVSTNFATKPAPLAGARRAQVTLSIKPIAGSRIFASRNSRSD
jgi:hypothetical protein